MRVRVYMPWGGSGGDSLQQQVLRPGLVLYYMSKQSQLQDSTHSCCGALIPVPLQYQPPKTPGSELRGRGPQ